MRPLLPLQPTSHRVGLDMRLALVIGLLAQSCGAWILPGSSLRPNSWPRKCGEPPKKLARVPSQHGAAGAGSRSRRFTAAVDGDPPTGGSATDDEDGGVDIVKARLRKPVGLVLAEREIGLPGLVVDDMTQGGSAKECGIVRTGMGLVSAGGVDCGGLVFDQVVELLQQSPAEEPIDFVFSAAEGGPP